MRYISLFSGIEAASCAWEPLGMEPVAFCEIDPFPSAVLAHRFPNVPNLGDIREVDWSEWRGAADVVVGGSPCQSFSVAAGAGRTGLEGASGLMLEYVRAVSEIMPRFVVWENVPGCLSSGRGGEKGADFGCLLRSLEELGYGVCWRVLDSQFFGVAQRRERVFLVGELGARPPVEVLFEPEGLLWDFESGREKRQAIAEGSRTGADRSCISMRYQARPSSGNAAVSEDGLSPTITADWHAPAVAFAQNTRDEVRYQGDGDICVALSAQPGMKQQTYVVCMADDATRSAVDVDLCGTLKRGGGHAVRRVALSNGQDVIGALCARDFKGVGSQYASDGKVIMDRTVVRRLTPIECERLQGFKDDWTKVPYRGKLAGECPDGPRYKAIGNSMTVNVMAWIGRRLIAHADGTLVREFEEFRDGRRGYQMTLDHDDKVARSIDEMRIGGK